MIPNCSNTWFLALRCAGLGWVVLCRDLCVLAAGTQNASEGDHIRDAGQTADMIEEADRCQQLQGSASGLDDDPDLHDMSSPADDQIVTSDRMPSRSEDVSRTHEHQWHSALVVDFSDKALQLHGTASQQRHHERMSEAQRTHQGFHRALQGQSPPEHSGYQTMNGHGSFKPRKIQDHFRRIGMTVKEVEDPAACVDPLHSVVAVGFRHLSPEFCTLPLLSHAQCH